jgi:hypothetical protein
MTASLLHGGAALLGAVRPAWQLPCWTPSTAWVASCREGRRWGAPPPALSSPFAAPPAGGAPPLLFPQGTFKRHVRVFLMSSAGRSMARACGGRVSVGRRRARIRRVRITKPLAPRAHSRFALVSACCARRRRVATPTGATARQCNTLSLQSAHLTRSHFGAWPLTRSPASRSRRGPWRCRRRHPAQRRR